MDTRAHDIVIQSETPVWSATMFRVAIGEQPGVRMKASIAQTADHNP